MRSASICVSPDERYRGERALAIARVFLVVSLAIVGALDPVRDTGAFSLVARLLGAYLVVAVAILGLLLIKPAGWSAMAVVVHVIDVSMTAAVMLATVPGAPAWILAVFVLLAAAHRWGMREAIGTAAAVIVLLLTQAVLVSLTQGSIGVGRVAEAVGVRRLIVVSTLVLLGGVFLAYLAQAEKQFRAEATAIGALVSRVELRSGLKNTMGAVFDAIVQLTHAERAVLVVREIGTGQISRWEGGRQTGPAPTVRVSAMDGRSFADYMFAPEAAAWYAIRRRTRLDVVALDRDGSRSEHVPQAFPDPFLEALGPFRRLMAIGFELPGEVTGRLFLVDPHVDSDRETALAFVQRMLRHVTPAVHNVYLLHRLRTRSAANERARVARELHDGIIQGVLGVQIQLHALSVPAAQTSGALASELKRLGTLLRDETVSLRDMMQRLTPLELAPDQLMDTLAEVVHRFQRDTGITARFITPLDRLDLSPRACREVTRVVQEALVNVRKHSGAQNAIVRLTADDDVCQLSIDDDGRGFPFAGQASVAVLEKGRVAPFVIRERVRALGGRVAVDSEPGRGTRIEITLPLPNHSSRGYRELC